MSDNNNNTVTVYIDDQAYQVSTDDNLLAGVLSQKLNLPYFCWHPSMGSVGACRQCAVTQYQDENDTRGRLVMACTTPVTDGMRISLKDTQSETFREQVIGAMMTNHPHDCPVCAEGGECHLQDMTVMTGHSTRDYKGDKRTFNNQYLGEFVGHEMNRCITCYRCVRFYKDYAGGTDFGVYGSRNNVYFGRQTDGQLESEFSGNLVEVCPTGVFTNKLFSAHYTRKWDLQSAPSVCAHCSVGCNTSVGERYGSVRRVMNRYNQDLNGYFLCDRGRFGIGFVNGEQRIRSAKGIRQTAPHHLSKLDVSKALVHYKGQKFIGIGSERASYEANYYLKSLVGNESFSLGLNAVQMNIAAVHKRFIANNSAPSLRDIEQCDFILIVDEDITQTAPRMALAVRQALRNASIEKADLLGIPAWQDSAVRTIGGNSKSPMYLLQSKATKLDDVAEHVVIQNTATTEKSIKELTDILQSNVELSLTGGKSHEMLSKLLTAKNPLIIGGWSCNSPTLVKAISEFVEVVKQKQKAIYAVIMPPQANTMGLVSMLDKSSLSLEQVLDAITEKEANKEIDGIVLLEQELSQLTPSQIEKLRQDSLTIIAIEHSESKVTELSDIVLPASPVTENDGSFINYQGKIQSFPQVLPSVLPVQQSWRWLSHIASAIFPQSSFNQSCDSLAELQDMFAEHDSAWPIKNSDFLEQTARETNRASGRTAKMANLSVHEAKVTQSNDGYRFSMEGDNTKPNSNSPFTWAPGWNSNQSIHQFQEKVAGKLIKSDQLNTIDFSDDDSGDFSWPVSADCGSNKSFFSIVPWFRVEWQSSLTPEFQMVEHSNYIAVSKQLFKDNGWVHAQYLKVQLNDEANNTIAEAIAQVYVDERIQDDTIYGDIDCLGKHQVCNVDLSTATDDEVEKYRSQQKQKQSDAKQEQARTLARLKQQDQHIPIRLVSGGLDDV